MFPAMLNSPVSQLTAGISSTDTIIPVGDANKFPEPPNIATIGIDRDDAETIRYTGKSGNNLTGVTRGFQGQAKSWSAGTLIARVYTKYDHDKFIEEINTHKSDYATHKAEHLRIEIGVALPENINSKTFWLEDLGESIDFALGGGLLIGNASTDGSDDVWFDENV